MPTQQSRRASASLTVALFDEESGTYICGEEIKRGLICNGTPYSPNWKCPRHGGILRINPDKKLRANNSIYSRNLWKGYKKIHEELSQSPEDLESLFTSDILDELALSRVLLMEVIRTRDDGTEPDRKQVQDALKQVTVIAKLVRDIQEKEHGLIKREFMDSIISAVVHAFTRANSYARTSDRARIFMSEFAGMLPGDISNLAIDLPIPTDNIIATDIDIQPHMQPDLQTAHVDTDKALQRYDASTNTHKMAIDVDAISANN